MFRDVRRWMKVDMYVDGWIHACVYAKARLCLCIYVCMFAFVYVCMYGHMYVRMDDYMYLWMAACMSVWLVVFMADCTYIYVWMHESIYNCMYEVNMHVCMLTWAVNWQYTYTYIYCGQTILTDVMNNFRKFVKIMHLLYIQTMHHLGMPSRLMSLCYHVPLLTFCSSEIELRSIRYGLGQRRCLGREEGAKGSRETPTYMLTRLPPGLWQHARWHMSQWWRHTCQRWLQKQLGGGMGGWGAWRGCLRMNDRSLLKHTLTLHTRLMTAEYNQTGLYFNMYIHLYRYTHICMFMQ